jgi:ABC-type nitrate/sulfonate/bicarbonate transport system substrate-binding protein
MLKKTVQTLAALVMMACLYGAMSAQAQTIRVGKAVPEAFSFVPLDVGIRQGFFKKRGLDIESIAFAGDAKMQQAAAAGGVDFLLGSGPALGYIAKGAPVKGIAAMAGPPLLLAIVVRPDGPKTAADLKDKKVSVSTAGSLTYFLVSETSRRQGWGPKGIDIKPMGAMPGQIAALKRGDIDGIIKSVDAYLARSNDKTKFVPGHGDLMTKAQVADYRKMLVDARAAVKKLKVAGMTEDQVVAAKPLAGDIQTRAGANDMASVNFVRLIYKSVS